MRAKVSKRLELFSLPTKANYTQTSGAPHKAKRVRAIFYRTVCVCVGLESVEKERKEKGPKLGLFNALPKLKERQEANNKAKQNNGTA